jgi:hypothetical protein
LIALDGKSAIEALRREAWRIPPASTSFEVKGTGARDAAIWLSLVKESIERSERIFFISDDKRAFKAPELARDLDKTSAAVTVLEDIGELLKVLADDVDVAIDVALIAESDSLRERVLQYLGSTSIPSDALSIAMEFSVPSVGCSYSDHKFTRIEYLSARDIRGHVIGNETWVTGVVRWSVTYSVGVEWYRHDKGIKNIPDELWDVTFQTSSVLIFSRSSNEIDGVEVLSAGKPATVSRYETSLR